MSKYILKKKKIIIILTNECHNIVSLKSSQHILMQLAIFVHKYSNLLKYQKNLVSSLLCKHIIYFIIYIPVFGELFIGKNYYANIFLWIICSQANVWIYSHKKI